MLKNSFFQFPHLPKLDSKYVSEALNAKYILPEPEVNGIKTSRATWAWSTFADTKFFQDLSAGINQPFTAVYYRFPAMSYYDWHTDRDRECSINFVLTDNPNYLTVFRAPTDNRIIYDIRVCDYTVLEPVLFNTQISHSITNYSNQTRYILTLASETASLTEVKDFLFSYQTTSY
jgi:hypothetical protein